MANVTINGHDYAGITEVLLPITNGDGAEQSFVLPPAFQNKTVSPITTQQTVSPDSGYDGLSVVTVSAIQTETKTATPSETAQTVTPSDGKYLTSVIIEAIQTEAKSVSPSETAQTITPSSGKYLKQVAVDAVPSDYVGSDIPRRSSSNLSASGATVTVPAGYYSENASKSVASGTAGTPSATKGSVNNHSITITPTVSNTAGYISGGTKTGTVVTVSASELVSGSQALTGNSTYDVTNLQTVIVSVPSDTPVTQEKTVAPSTSLQEVTPDSGKLLSKVTVNAIQTETADITPSETAQTVMPSGGKYLTQVTVDAVPSDYVGSGIPRRSSSNLSASSATVTVPAGYYSSNGSKSVASGTAGTPSATKGSVNNHSITVTPSVTNFSGYISGGTKTGSAVTVSASELVSGSQTITGNDTYDVTNLQTVIVSVPSDAPALTTLNATANGSYTPSGYAGYSSVTVAIPTYDGSVS